MGAIREDSTDRNRPHFRLFTLARFAAQLPRPLKSSRSAACPPISDNDTKRIRYAMVPKRIACPVCRHQDRGEP